MAKDTTANKPNKPKKEKKKRGNPFKETFSELKKVTWPSFGTVIKQTGIVLAVVLVFLLVLMGFDALFQWLYKLLVTGLNADTDMSALMLSLKTFSGVGLPLCL